jgi:hypothetical protein
VNTRGDCGAHDGEAVLGVGVEEVGLEVERVIEDGPTQGPFANYVGLIGTKQPSAFFSGLKVLRTKKGDLNIASPLLSKMGRCKY